MCVIIGVLLNFDMLFMLIFIQTNGIGVEVGCVSLDGQLAKLEVLGSQAFQLLQKILHPITL